MDFDPAVEVPAGAGFVERKPVLAPGLELTFVPVLAADGDSPLTMAVAGLAGFVRFEEAGGDA